MQIDENEYEELREAFSLSIGIMCGLVYQLEPPPRPHIWSHIAWCLKLNGCDNALLRLAEERAGLKNP